MNGLLATAARKLRREWRSGELAVLLGALVVAVAAMTAVGFFTDRVAGAVSMQAAEVLAADLVLSSGREIAPQVYTRAREAGLQTATKLSFPSVVLAGDASALADIEAVTRDYPLRGRLRVAATLTGAPAVTDEVPGPGEAWAEARLLARLDTTVGAEIAVGEQTLRVTRVLDFAPDRGWRFADLAPSLMIHLDEVPATGLVQPGSRVSWSALFAGDAGKIEAFKDTLNAEIAPHESLRDLGDLQPEMRSAVERAGRFLSLAALVAALLAAVALAMAARRYAARQLDTVALMKCLGASQRRIVAGVAVELLLLALAGGALGSALGWLAQQGLSWLAADLIGAALPAASGRSVALGFAVAAVLLAGFALPPLVALRRVPPARVLNRDLPAATPGRAVIYGAAIVAVTAILWWLVRDAELVGWLLAGTAATVALLFGIGWLFVFAVRRLRGAGSFAWRYGLANIGRRGGDSVTQLVAFGLGLMALLLLTVVRNDLLETWRATLPDSAPNQFMINIQPEEVEAVAAFLERRTGTRPEIAPLVRARLVAIGAESIAEMEFASARGRRFARRESNLSWTAELPDDNELVAGRWWGGQPAEGGEVSVETEFADALGIGIGDRLVFDVAGEQVSAPITSVRSVEWDSFRPNFFMLLSPNVLEDYPATYIGSLHVPGTSRSTMIDLVREFPGITTIDMNAVLDQVRGVMDKAALAVQYVFVFTLVAGVTVLLAAVQSTLDERRYESAMLRTFGASRAVITRGVATEFVALGLLSGLLAALGAGAAAWVLARKVFELDYWPGGELWLLGLALGALLVGASGSLATRRVVNTPPVHTLRA